MATPRVEPPLPELKSEKSLADDWNLSTKNLGLVRHARLREGYHFQVHNSHVWYTPVGEKALLEVVVPQPKGPRPSRPEPPPAEALLSERVVVVWRLPPNPRILLCKDGAGQTISIRTRWRQKFRRGMKIDLATQCELDPHMPGSKTWPARYLYLGPAPRCYGRY
jgi:hypothetical protein